MSFSCLAYAIVQKIRPDTIFPSTCLLNLSSFYIFAIIFCIIANGWVKVENDITTYLPDSTETRQGLTIMNDQFVTYGTARVMVSNISYEKGEELAEELKEIDGVTDAVFDNTEDHYKNSSALFDVTFDGTTTDDVSVNAIHEIEDKLSGYDTYIGWFRYCSRTAKRNAGYCGHCRYHYRHSTDPDFQSLCGGSRTDRHLRRSCPYEHGYQLPVRYHFLYFQFGYCSTAAGTGNRLRHYPLS